MYTGHIGSAADTPQSGTAVGTDIVAAGIAAAAAAAAAHTVAAGTVAALVSVSAEPIVQPFGPSLKGL